MAGKKIFILDDEAVVADLAKLFLVKVFPDSEIEGFGAPQDAVSFLDAQHDAVAPDVLFIDSSLGNDETNGVLYFEEMAAALKDRGLPLPRHVVFSSGEEDYAVACKALAEQGGLLPPECFYAIKKDQINVVYPFFLALAGGEILDPESPSPSYDIKRLLKATLDMSPENVARLVSSQEKKLHTEGIQEQLADKAAFDQKCAGFRRGAGHVCHGVAAFSVEEAQALKGSILILDHNDPELLNHLADLRLSGLVVRDATEAGHLEILANALGISTLIGAKTEEDWQKVLGFSGQGELTVNPFGKAGLAEGVWKTSRGTSPVYSRDIRDVCRAVASEVCVRVLSNVDTLQHVMDAVTYGSDGIGLVRTEHLVLLDREAAGVLRSIFLGGDEADPVYRTFRDVQRRQASDIFTAIKTGLEKNGEDRAFPVRIRLLDAPPGEFLSDDEVTVLSQSVPPEKQRGVQMGMVRPLLYQNQIEAIFEAYKEQGSSPARLEIMVPSVETIEELRQVKAWVAHAAEKVGLGRDAYAFGMMFETVPALLHAGDFASEIDFGSFGTNDLTADVLGIARSDEAGRRAYSEQTGKQDPFVVLDPDVASVIGLAVVAIKSRNPVVSLSICGKQAEDLDTLKTLLPLGLDSFSVQPSDRNMYALPADCYVDALRKALRPRTGGLAHVGVSEVAPRA